MGRVYASILGLLAFLGVVVKGLIDGGGAETTFGVASACLFLFAAIGYVVGQTAGWIVDDSVRSEITAQIEASKAPEENAGRAASG